MQIDDFNDGLLAFLKASVTPFHAVAHMAQWLDAAGYSRLDEHDDWDCEDQSRYYVIRNASSIVAFTCDQSSLMDEGIKMVGAHTDSPCLKVKPQPDLVTNNYLQLAVEVYGGALLNPWFDRDLSLAGRVSFRDSNGQINSSLIDFSRPLAVIPSLAIHLDREANKNRTINAQTDISPLIALKTHQADSRLNALLLKELNEQEPSAEAQDILAHELFFYDTQAPSIIGLNDELIVSARLDNLLSCYTGLMALLDASAEGAGNRLLVCNDHEEVGSLSASGAQGPFLKSVLERVYGDSASTLTRIIDQSMMISADNAHALHPNYADKHDKNHGPLLNHGPVIKVNANQRYTSNSDTVAAFKDLCEQVDVPVQTFVMKNDMGCGSTIGPITAGEIGIPSIDIGVPTFAMHSIRETAGHEDAHSLYKVLKVYFSD